MLADPADLPATPRSLDETAFSASGSDSSGLEDEDAVDESEEDFHLFLEAYGRPPEAPNSAFATACSRAYSDAIAAGLHKGLDSPRAFFLSGMAALGRRSGTLLFAACRHLDIKALSVVRGHFWGCPAGSDVPRIWMTAARNAFAFSKGDNCRVSLVFNADLYSLLVFYDDGGGDLKVLGVTTGAGAQFPDGPCDAQVRLRVCDAVSITPTISVPSEALERTALLGVVILATQPGMTFPLLVETVKKWSLTLGDLPRTVGGQGPPGYDPVAMMDLVEATSVASYVAHRLIYDKRTNDSVIGQFGHHNRLEGAIDFGREVGTGLLGEISWQDASKTVLCLRKVDVEEDEVMATLRSTTGAICAAVHANCTHMDVLCNLSRYLRAVRKRRGLPKDQREAIPREDINSGNMSDFVLYADREPMTLPCCSASYSNRALPTLHKQLVRVLPSTIVDIVGAYVLTQATANPNYDQERKQFETALRVRIYRGGGRSVVFTYGGDAPAVFKCAPSLSPFTLQIIEEDPMAVSYSTPICSEFLDEGDAIFDRALRRQSYEPVRHLMAQRFFRAKVYIFVTFPDKVVNFESTGSGDVRQLLRERPSMSGILEKSFSGGSLVALSLYDRTTVPSGSPRETSIHDRLAARLIIRVTLPKLDLVEPPQPMGRRTPKRHRGDQDPGPSPRRSRRGGRARRPGGRCRRLSLT
jgi:hypothetical protein